MLYYQPETSVGIPGLAKFNKPLRDFAYQLTKRGFVTLSIGTLAAWEAKTYSILYPSKEDAKIQPLSALGYAAANAYHVLASNEQPENARSHA